MKVCYACGVEQKEFEKWHQEKKSINEKEARIFFAEHEVWICSLGANIGSEQDGKGDLFVRPVVILKKFNGDVFWGIPLTHARKAGMLYFDLTMELGGFAILSQIRLLDAKRLHYKLAALSAERFMLLKEAFLKLATQEIVNPHLEGGGGQSPVVFL
jgi:mRNA-degrading endonuclease toxin of MazEF toxin-antitoxin module